MGDDVTVGEELVGTGFEIGPALLGVLASQGFSTVFAHPRPRVGVLFTGNELTDSRDDLGTGKIRDANRPSLLASLAASGFTPVDLGIAGDTPREITEALTGGLRTCDAIVSTGGVSVGDADFVKSVARGLRWRAARDRCRSRFDRANRSPSRSTRRRVRRSLVSPATRCRPSWASNSSFARRSDCLAGHRELDRPTSSMVLDCPLPRRRDGKLNLVHVIVRWKATDDST